MQHHRGLLTSEGFAQVLGQHSGGCLGVLLSHKVLWVLPDLIPSVLAASQWGAYYPPPRLPHHMIGQCCPVELY